MPKMFEDLLACLVIGPYVRRVVAVDSNFSYSGLPIDWLEALWTTPLGYKVESDFSVYPMGWRLPMYAVYYLRDNPDSAHMLDLSVDELLNLYKLGSHMAGCYAAIRFREDSKP